MLPLICMALLGRQGASASTPSLRWSLMNLIINFTPTGMIPTKEMTPHVPITVQEVVENVHEAVEIGITMVHIHARDKRTGEPTYKAEVYEDIIAGIRKFSRDLVISVSLSGRTFREFEQRAEPLRRECQTGHGKFDLKFGKL